jgi:hypothetical protein
VQSDLHTPGVHDVHHARHHHVGTTPGIVEVPGVVVSPPGRDTRRGVRGVHHAWYRRDPLSSRMNAGPAATEPRV